MAEAKEDSRTSRGPAPKRLSSKEELPPLMSGHEDGQNRRSEGDPGTRPDMQTKNVLADIAEEAIVVPTRIRTQGWENPGTRSFPSEQERSSPEEQSQAREGRGPQSHHSTQTSQRPQDRRERRN